ncbi:MAG TPA: H-X9-DG-CTERM domain-containing protein, partial [Anaerolineae bacterium]|nr:H-X9-DG-CTERM domain-containing protein [Anaerolineae bacterium]
SCGKQLDMITDPQNRKDRARHLGGSNVGFMDGHAAWFQAEYILSESPQYSCGCWGGGVVYRKFKGISAMGPTSAAGTGAIPGDYCYPDIGVLY